MAANTPPFKRTPFFCQLDNERHPATADRYQCVECGRLMCKDCYEAQMIVGLSSCPFCSGKLILLASGGKIVKSPTQRSQVVSPAHNLPTTPLTWIERARDLESQGNNMEALENYTIGLKAFPNDVDLLKNKAYVLESLAFHQAAIDCYDAVLEVNPTDNDALNNKGVSLVSLKRYDEALECYDQAIMNNPEDLEAWFNRGAILELLKHPHAALKSYQKVISLDPNDNEVQNKVKVLSTQSKQVFTYNQFGKYGAAAVKAVELILNKQILSPVEAWDEATSEVFRSGTSGQTKGCPKGAFLGLCEVGFVRGIPRGKYTNSIRNKSYAMKAVILLQHNPDLSLSSDLLWTQVMKAFNKAISHNEQMNVVLALWNNDLIVSSA